MLSAGQSKRDWRSFGEEPSVASKYLIYDIRIDIKLFPFQDEIV